MFKKKKLFTKAAALAALGVVLATSSASAANQNTTHYDKNINTTLKDLCSGTVGTGAQNATQEITSRVKQYGNARDYCDVYFVHKNKKTGKYATIGLWITSMFGKSNCKYLKNSNVKPNTPMLTRSQTRKNPYSGATKTSIAGTVKY